MKNSPRRAANCRASICPIDKSHKPQAPSSKPGGGGGELARATSLRQFVTLTQDVVVRQFGS